VDRSPTVIRVLEIAVVPASQRRGVARRVMLGLQDEASGIAAAVRLSVWQDNLPARSLYAGLGFVVEQEREDGYLELSWSTTKKGR
jgi:ribosomal protein S18 acetylase RimI-like enzyme